MAISTYSELKTAIANFLARDDMTSVIPDFIQLAEARMSRELETRSQEKRSQATLTVGDEYIALPSDLREVREVKLNTTPVTVLTYYSPTSLDQTFSSGGNGKPQGFSIVGVEMKLRPKPDSAYTAEIIYIGGVPALSDSTPSNNILLRSPDAYLYGSLAEAYSYLLDEVRAAQYMQRFSVALEEIKVDEQRAHYGTGSLQINSIYSRQNAAVE
ncbi:MAG: hypothetical protein DWQ28_06460 [Proteobacteria bacterium]|nr:MAG: hypothetical protein DWQ28_06155 [Pseudomonadota bacterium]REJ67674.1 MAG: hypothetical protein DWQ28_06460 [Pseudomonadota bacterium]